MTTETLVAPACKLTPMTRMKWPTQAAVPNFFGKIEIGRNGLPTDNSESRMLKQINLPIGYPMRLAWDTGTTVKRLTCHRQVAQSLSQILQRVLDQYGFEWIQKHGMDLFGGCYNFRPMRGSHVLSMHSYGIAIDLDPEHNPLGKKWEPNAGMIPMEIVDLFESAGWTWGGRWKSRPDTMHFQAASV